MLTHKGYLGKVEFDDEFGIFHGRVINTQDVITFQGTTVPEIKQAFLDSVEGYLEFCAELGEEPERSYSGHLALDLPNEVHRDIALAATLEEKQLNTWILEHLTEAANRALQGRLDQLRVATIS